MHDILNASQNMINRNQDKTTDIILDIVQYWKPILMTPMRPIPTNNPDTAPNHLKIHLKPDSRQYLIHVMTIHIQQRFD
jgi:hypothetical protein